jgi:hypothetical protein
MIERAGPSPEDVIHDPTARLMKLRKVELSGVRVVRSAL